MTTATKHEVTRRHAAPAARQGKSPAPVLVAGINAAASFADRIGPLLADFTRLDALAAGADALMAQLPALCPRVDTVRRQIAQAAELADKTRNAADECSLGRLGPWATADAALLGIAHQAEAAGALFAAGHSLLEATDWETDLPLVRAFPLIELATELCDSLATRLRDLGHEAIALRVAA